MYFNEIFDIIYEGYVNKQLSNSKSTNRINNSQDVRAVQAARKSKSGRTDKTYPGEKANKIKDPDSQLINLAKMFIDIGNDMKAIESEKNFVKNKNEIIKKLENETKYEDYAKYILKEYEKISEEELKISYMKCHAKDLSDYFIKHSERSFTFEGKNYKITKEEFNDLLNKEKKGPESLMKKRIERINKINAEENTNISFSDATKIAFRGKSSKNIDVDKKIKNALIIGVENSGRQEEIQTKFITDSMIDTQIVFDKVLKGRINIDGFFNYVGRKYTETIKRIGNVVKLNYVVNGKKINWKDEIIEFISNSLLPEDVTGNAREDERVGNVNLNENDWFFTLPVGSIRLRDKNGKIHAFDAAWKKNGNYYFAEMKMSISSSVKKYLTYYSKIANQWQNRGVNSSIIKDSGLGEASVGDINKAKNIGQLKVIYDKNAVNAENNIKKILENINKANELDKKTQENINKGEIKKNNIVIGNYNQFKELEKDFKELKEFFTSVAQQNNPNNISIDDFMKLKAKVLALSFIAKNDTFSTLINTEIKKESDELYKTIKGADTVSYKNNIMKDKKVMIKKELTNNESKQLVNSLIEKHIILNFRKEKTYVQLTDYKFEAFPENRISQKNRSVTNSFSSVRDLDRKTLKEEANNIRNRK